MTREIFRTPQFRQDYTDIFSYIATDNPKAAESLLLSFDATLELLLANPKMARIREELGDIHLFPVGNYLIAYREVAQGIEAISVVHGARDIPAVLENL